MIERISGGIGKQVARLGNKKGMSGKITAGLGGAIGGGLPWVIGAAAAAALKGQQARFQQMQQIGDLEYQLATAQRFGLRHLGAGALGLAGLGADFGLMPGETMGQLQQFAQARGTVGAINRGFGNGGFKDILRLSQASGVGMGALGNYAYMFGAGGGGASGRYAGAQTPIGIAASQGLRGARIEEWLGQLSKHAQMLANQGMKLNIGDVNMLTARMQNTAGLRGTGVLQPQLVQKAGGIASGLKQQLTAPFAGLVQARVMMKAMRSGGGIMGAVKALEQMESDPTAVFDLLQGGGELGQLSVMGAFGVGSSAAKGVTSLSKKGAFGGVGLPGTFDALVQKRKLFAEHEANLMRSVLPGAGEEDVKPVDVLKDILRIQKDIHDALVTVAEGAEAMIKFFF